MQNDMRENTILICVKYQNERMEVCITLRQTSYESRDGGC